MNVLVLTSRAPFADDDPDNLCDQLVRNLLLCGAQAEALRLPFHPRSAEGLIDELVFTRSLRLENVDRLIGLRFPAYVVPHHNKALWLNDTGATAYAAGADDRSRDAIWHADNAAFSEARHIYTTTQRAAGALRRSHRFESTVVPVPRSENDWKSAIEHLLS